jgi:hypothetical protein
MEIEQGGGFNNVAVRLAKGVFDELSLRGVHERAVLAAEVTQHNGSVLQPNAAVPVRDEIILEIDVVAFQRPKVNSDSVIWNWVPFNGLIVETILGFMAASWPNNDERRREI